MPSWSIHLAIAKKINQKLELGDNFIIGNILPDVLNGYIIKNPSKIVGSEITHYRNKEGNYFLKKYQNKMNNPMILGYFCHLIADDFFNTYYCKHYIINKNNKVYVKLKNLKLLECKNIKPYQLKQKDFELFGQKLINEKLVDNVIQKNENTMLYLSDLPFTINDINKTICFINDLVSKTYAYNKDKYKIFTEEELNKLLEECCQIILEKIRKNS